MSNERKIEIPGPRVGLGCMGMSEFYGAREDAGSLQTLHQAFELGYRHFDTADMYGMGANERLIGRFLSELGARRHEVLVATKAGIRRNAESPRSISVDSSPGYVRRACEDSLRRLRIETVDLFYVHRRDPTVPIEDTAGALAQLHAEGKIRAAGLSEVSAVTLERAHAVFPVSALQSEYSLWSRDVEREILDACERLQVAFVAYSPLGRGFLAKGPAEPWASPDDLRHHLPRFQSDNLKKNRLLVDELAEVARRLQQPPSVVALRWVLEQRRFIHVIPGTRRLEHLRTNLRATWWMLPPADRDALSTIFDPQAIAGGRYPEHLLRTVNV